MSTERVSKERLALCMAEVTALGELSDGYKRERDETRKLLSDRDAEIAAWHAICDEQGLPHDPAMLVQHHRGNGKMIGAADAYAKLTPQIADRDAEIVRLREVVDAAIALRQAEAAELATEEAQLYQAGAHLQSLREQIAAHKALRAALDALGTP
jgi:hypothetical protein